MYFLFFFFFFLLFAVGAWGTTLSSVLHRCVRYCLPFNSCTVQHHIVLAQ
jgi:hypothetical protein